MISIVLFFIIGLAYSSPIKCATTAPYNLKQTSTVLAAYDITRQGMAWYEYRLATLIENLNLLPPSQVEAALDLFMEVYCEEPYFKGFIGITGDGTLFTNRTMVRELYKANALQNGTHVPFNVKIYNLITFIKPESQINHNSIYVNITAFNEHIMRTTDPVTGDARFWIVNGHYQNEFRIDEDGNVCISGFFDDFRILNEVPHTSLLAIPWDLPITSL